jgi:hypothetical protein
MPAIHAALAQDGARNEIIFDGALSALEAKRSPVVLTERRDHLQYGALVISMQKVTLSKSLI